MEPSYSPSKYLGPGAGCGGCRHLQAAGQAPEGAETTQTGRSYRRAQSDEFEWRRAERPAAAGPRPAGPAAVAERNRRLSAAAELARRCAELGVQPPLPQPPKQVAHDAAAVLPPHAARLDALSQQLHQQGNMLVSAVQGQTAQLAAQQALLRDAVQGLLFVSAKAARPASAAAQRPGSAPLKPAQSAAALTTAALRPGQAADAAPTAARSQPPAWQGATTEQPLADPAPWHMAANVHGLADRLSRLRDTQVASSGDERGDVAALSGAGAGAISPPCGMLRVPHAALSSPAGAQTRARAAPRHSVPETSGAERPAGSPAARERQHVRPAWDDTTVMPRPRGNKSREAWPPPLPPRRVAGGLVQQLLRHELQRLRRHRSLDDGTARGSRPGSSRRSVTGGAQNSRVRPATASGAAADVESRQPAPAPACRPRPAPARLRFPHAKEAHVAGRAGQVEARARAVGGAADAAASGAGARGEPPVSVSAAHTARRGSSPARPAAAPAQPDVACARASWLQEMGEEPGRVPPLSDADVEAVCDRLCQELLLRECAPCAPCFAECELMHA